MSIGAAPLRRRPESSPLVDDLISVLPIPRFPGGGVVVLVDALVEFVDLGEKLVFGARPPESGSGRPDFSVEIFGPHHASLLLHETSCPPARGSFPVKVRNRLPSTLQVVEEAGFPGLTNATFGDRLEDAHTPIVRSQRQPLQALPPRPGRLRSGSRAGGTCQPSSSRIESSEPTSTSVGIRPPAATGTASRTPVPFRRRP